MYLLLPICVIVERFYMKKINLFVIAILLPFLVLAQSKTILHFDSNKSTLKKNEIAVLDSIIAILKIKKQYQISIHGYCDASGNESDNQILSDNRSLSVFNYLQLKNIMSSSMMLKGFAANAPIANNDTENGKAQNRRVELIIKVNDPVVVKTVMKEEVLIPKEQTLNAPKEQNESFGTTSSINDLEVGKTVVLKNLNFEPGTAVLLPEAKPTLELLVKIMKDNPSLVIEIGGHVCCANDMPLSVYRAKSVYKYLIKKGIEAPRMTFKGYSRDRPIYEFDRGEFEARANRRVEITVLEK
jgi:outer membrane protein OmpA-like peptidoglycan-associated protein